MATAQADGYVECSECGHPIEVHNTKGCQGEGCECSVPWTHAEIRQVRRREGLPGSFNLLDV